MINKEKKYDNFIFTHIPKCGGTSFRKYINDSAIEANIDTEKIYIPGFNGLANNKNLNQLNKSEIQKLKSKNIKIFANHTKYGELKNYGFKLENSFNFTILRNPIERFVSHYHFFYFLNGYDDCKGVKLNDLNNNKLIKLLDLLSNIQVSYISNIKHKKIVGLENMLKIAKYNIEYEFDLFGTIENLKPTLNNLREIQPMNLNFKNDFPLLNRSQSKIDGISKKIIALIKEANEVDMKFYEFAINMKPNTINH